MSLIQAAERAGLDYVFLADAWGSRGEASTELEAGAPMLFAGTLAGVLIGASDRIKVITTMHQAWWHPLHIARVGANLDALSGGRWGMNAVSGVGFAPELIASVNSVSDHDAMYDAAAESMEIVLQAWHNDGEVDFRGEHYEARGRLVGPYPVQKPHPMIVAAGASAAGREFAGRYADIPFIPGRANAELIAEKRDRILAAAERAGRASDDVRIILHASVIVGESQAEADALATELLESIDLKAAYELVTTVTKGITTYEDIFAYHSEEELREIGLTAGTRRIYRDAEHVAEQIQNLRETSQAYGLTLSFPLWGAEHVTRFGDLVVPLLERRGVWSRADSRGWPW